MDLLVDARADLREGFSFDLIRLMLLLFQSINLDRELFDLKVLQFDIDVVLDASVVELLVLS